MNCICSQCSGTPQTGCTFERQLGKRCDACIRAGERAATRKWYAANLATARPARAATAKAAYRKNYIPHPKQPDPNKNTPEYLRLRREAWVAENPAKMAVYRRRRRLYMRCVRAALRACSHSGSSLAHAAHAERNEATADVVTTTGVGV